MADRAEKEKVLVEPVAKRQDFFEWLEKLYDGTTQFPEKLLTCVVKGRFGEQLVSPPLKQIIYRPQVTSSKKAKEGDSTEESANIHGVINGKPTKEQIVKLSNELLFLCQRDCDQHGKEMRYGIHAMHFSCDPEIYERWIVRMSPQSVHAKGEGEDDDEEETDESGLPIHKRYANQFLGHNERMFTLNAEMSMGLYDRQHRELERTAKELADTREDLRRERDMAEKERAQNHQRMLDLQWNELKIKSVEKGLDLAVGLAPPVINQLMGKKVIPTNDSTESLTLKRFFKTDKEGGLLTEAQCDAAFGVYDDKNNIVSAGVLTKEQTNILLDVMHCRAQADALDRLIPPDGACAVSLEQIAQLQQIFPMEQIAPIIAMIGIRQQQRAANGK